MKFIDKKLSLKLKEKGFDRPCFGWYTFINNKLKLHTSKSQGETYKDLLYNYNCPGNTFAPTIEQVLEWLREEKNVHIGIIPYFTTSTKNNIMWGWEILLCGKIIECKNTLYVDKDYNFTKLASEDYCVSYDNSCINAIEFVINNLI